MPGLPGYLLPCCAHGRVLESPWFFTFLTEILSPQASPRLSASCARKRGGQGGHWSQGLTATVAVFRGIAHFGLQSCRSEDYCNNGLWFSFAVQTSCTHPNSPPVPWNLHQSYFSL